MSTFKASSLSVAIFLASLSSVPLVQANETLVLEEIIVTARKRAETLQEIPLSVHAISAHDIERQGIREMRDIVRNTPGVTFNSAGSMSTGSVVIRGMNQPGLIGDETNVAVFVDGVYVSGRDAAFLPLIGLERIEVVRGPQSALYGRNAFAGALNYITKKPSEEFEGKLEASAGDHGQQGFKARISGSLSDSFGVSLDLVDEESGSTHRDGSHYLGSIENKSQRLRMLFNPTENLELDFTYSHIDMQEAPQAGYEIAHNAWTRFERDFFQGGIWTIGAPERYIGTVEGRAPTGVIDAAEGTGMEADRFNLTATWDVGEYSISSITGSNDSETRAHTGYDTTYSGSTIVVSNPGTDGIISGQLAPLIGFPVGMFGSTTVYTSGTVVNDLSGNPFAPVNMYIIPTNAKSLGGQPNDDREDFSQEFRIQSLSDGPFKWSAGLLYAKTELTTYLTSSLIEPADALSALAFTFRTDVLAAGDSEATIKQSTDHETKTSSAFFDIHYDVSDKLELAFEGRYTKEDKSADNTIDTRAPGILFPTGFQEGNWSYFNPRVTASYQWDEDTLFYANAAKGTKSGGFNPGATGAEAEYEPESNITYEIGAKRTVLDGRGYMTAAIYFVDWDDQQIRNFSSTTSPGAIPGVIISNLGKTEILGLEIETAFKISENWSFNAGYTYSDAEIVSGTIGPDVGFTDFAALGQGSIDGCAAFGVNCFIPPTSFLPGVVGGQLQVSDGIAAGNRMPNSIENTINAGFSYTRDLNSGTEFYLNVDAVWKGDRYIDIANTMKIDSFADVNMQLGLEGEHWFGKINLTNIFDDDTPVSAYRPGVWTGEFQHTVINRNGRMGNVTVGYSF